MATEHGSTPARSHWTRAGGLAVAVGVLAAVGSTYVVLGLTDTLAYADGYRPGHWVVALYARSLVVTAAGWSLLAVAAVLAARAIGLVR